MYARSALAAVALVSFGASGCNGWPGNLGSAGGGGGGGSTAPVSAAVIDEVDVQPTATAVNDQYNISASITFHDDDAPVHLVRVYIPVIVKTLDYPAGDVETAAGASFNIQVSADPPLGGAGDTTFEFSLVDVDGGVSAPPVVKSVTLE